MDELIEILKGIVDGVDFENCTTLIDDNILDSLSIISLIAEIEEKFDVQVPTVEIIPSNFNSANAIWNLITRLQEEG